MRWVSRDNLKVADTWQEDMEMKAAQKKSKFSFDDAGATFAIVAWGGMLLSVLSQAF